MKLLHDDSGAILVLVLAALLILAIATTTLVGMTRTSMTLTSRVKNDVNSSVILKTGFNLGVGYIQQQLNEGGVIRVVSFTFDSTGYPTISHLSMGDSLRSGKNVVSIIDEQSKINLNQASRDELLRVPGITAPIADAIIDWRDSDHQDRGAAAELNSFRVLTAQYPCKNAPFESVEELLLIRNILPDLFGGLRRYVTVYGNGSVNLNSCSEEVLVILGLDESVARRIIDLRSGPDGVTGTLDDVIFESAKGFLAELKVRLALEDDEINELTRLVSEDRLGVRSLFYSVFVSTCSSGENLGRDLGAVVDFVDLKAPQVCFWSLR